jgi:hypothetical protein
MRIQSQFFLLFFLLTGNALMALSQRGKQVNIPENLLVGTTWKVNGTPFETKEKEQYTFSEINTEDFDGHWGHFISFDTTTFSSSYSAPCGNDCFTNVNGEYYFETSFKIHISVKEINRHGFCSKKSESLNRDYGYYTLERTATGWTLLKS